MEEQELQDPLGKERLELLESSSDIGRGVSVGSESLERVEESRVSVAIDSRCSTTQRQREHCMKEESVALEGDKSASAGRFLSDRRALLRVFDIEEARK